MRAFSGGRWCGPARLDTLGPGPAALRQVPCDADLRPAKKCGERGICEGMPTMAKQPAGRFAELLQRLRVRTGLTQEELAVAADVSPRTVSDLERGINRTARRDTAGLLADAMRLTGREREQFMATALGKPTAAEREA